MVNRDIAKLICDKLNINVSSKYIPTATYAVDCEDTFSSDLHALYKTASEEQLVILYQNMIYSWFFCCEPLSNFDWGWIECEDGTLKSTPFKLIKPFTNMRSDTKYRYGILQAQPDTLILAHTDMLYMKCLYKFYRAFGQVQDELIDEIMYKFGPEVIATNACFSMLLTRVDMLESIFLDASYKLPQVLARISDVDSDFYNNVKNADKGKILQQYSDEDILEVLDKVFEMEEN